MKTSIFFSLRLCISTAIGVGVAAVAVPSPVTTAQVQQQATQSNVIVIMRDQLAGVSLAGRQLSARAAAVSASQSGVISRLQRNRSRKITSFSTINAFATSVSADEVSTLVADPSVQAVVPDRELHLPRRVEISSTPVVATKAVTRTAASSASTSGLCGTLEPEALQLTNTASLDSTAATAQTVTDGNGIPVTGKGVKVAFIADGVDPNIAGFIRPDGSHVFVDYEDFSGDPAGTPTAGGEAFGDASSIAAQDTPNGQLLTFDISKFVNATHPLPSPCLIHIRGMAPGASLVGLKVFSNSVTTTSYFVQAIEYAIAHGVDVLNESFGGNPYPDNDNDPISLANTAAVQAGVTVTVSSGDAGSMGTLGSPATNPDVIAAGASTQFRSYAQTAYGVQALATGYASNNISGLSSGGFAQTGARTVDVVAPGDLGWALCSTNTTLFQDCTDYETPAQPTPIQDFGGTSEAAPLTAGEAALVIQAYRSTHGGKSPTPAVVKQIIMSTATDLNTPTSEQGAGLINALGAVHLALSYDDANGKPKAHGNSLLQTTTSVNLIAAANTHETETFTVTNTGAGARTISAALQTLGAPVAGATQNVTLSPATDPTFENPTGSPRSYVKKTFTVPAGTDHLDAAIGWQVSLTSSATPIVYLGLLDPSGRQAAYSIPQGFGSGYGHVDVGKPAAGTWTAVIWTRPAGVADSYAGPVQFTWAAEKFVSMGTVTPAKLTLAPGATGSFKADFYTPSEPGDLAAGLRFTETDGSYTLPQIPVTVRTLIPLGPTGGSFSGTLTGGNGRPGAGPTQTYEFNVPNNVQNMSLVVPISDNNYLLEGLLIDPNGMQLSVGLNLDPFGAPQYALQLFHYNPQPGLWRFILLQNYYSSGNQTSLPFTARIGFNNAQVAAAGLPNSASTVLSASGGPVTATSQVINTGAVTAAYFADARLTSQSFVQIGEQECSSTATLPGACGLFYFPTQTSAVQFRASSTVPIEMDAYNDVGFNVGGTGNPDIFGAQKSSGQVVASLAEPEVPYGLWVASPSNIGPYGAAGAPTLPVTLTAYGTIKNFDSAVSADSGDEWADLTLGTATFNPLLLPPGEGGIITLTITPDPTQVGKTVTGYVYIDTYNAYAGTGDEVVAIPYSYTVGQ
jgi:hypothetical protein